jgi:DNA-binding IclR family transcriptional regulator
MSLFQVTYHYVVALSILWVTDLSPENTLSAVTTRTAPEGTQAVLRAIRLLKSFSRERPELSLSELGTDLSKTTAHRLLAALESEGLVTRDPGRGTYRLGPTIIALGTQALMSNDLRALAQPELESLAAETGETATLEVLTDRRVLIVSEVPGRQLVTVAAEVGTRWPLHATSTGKAILAALSEEERRSMIAEPLERRTARTIVDPAELARELDRVAVRGYATVIEELASGAAAVAVAITDSLGRVLGAISLGGPVNRLGADRLAELAEHLTHSRDKILQMLEPGEQR